MRPLQPDVPWLLSAEPNIMKQKQYVKAFDSQKTEKSSSWACSARGAAVWLAFLMFYKPRSFGYMEGTTCLEVLAYLEWCVVS